MKEKYKEDLKEIKDIMNRSSRFISLSGLSGIAAGIIALVGAYLAYQLVFINQNFQSFDQTLLADESLKTLLLIAFGTLILSILVTFVFTHRATKKYKQNLWDAKTKRLFISLMIPLLTGGIIGAILLYKGFLGIALPLSLIFYGLSLVNAGKYTLNEVRTLGLIEIVLGLMAMVFIEHGLLFWAIGFGALHIVYGIIMQWKYKS